MYRLLIKILIWIHNLSYRLIGVIAIRENGGIHPKHRITNYHEFFLKNISSSDTVLDIGCGNGFLAYDLSRKVERIVAIDIDRKNIEIAKKKFSRPNLEYLLGNAVLYDFKEKFDAIVLSNVLEHIQDRISFLTKIKKIADKILLRVPLLSRGWLPIYKKENGMEYRLDKSHYTEYTTNSFREEISKAGLTINNCYENFGELYAILENNDEKIV